MFGPVLMLDPGVALCLKRAKFGSGSSKNITLASTRSPTPDTVRVMVKNSPTI